MSETLFSLADSILSALFVAVRQGWPDTEAVQQDAKRQLLLAFCGTPFPKLCVLFNPGALMLLVKLRSKL